MVFMVPLMRGYKAKFQTVHLYFPGYTSSNDNFEHNYPLNVPERASYSLFLFALIRVQTKMTQRTAYIHN